MPSGPWFTSKIITKELEDLSQLTPGSSELIEGSYSSQVRLSPSPFMFSRSLSDPLPPHPLFPPSTCASSPSRLLCLCPSVCLPVSLSLSRLQLQDFIFVLRGKEHLLAVTQMTNTNIHNGPDPDARPPPLLHTHTRKHVSTPVCRCEDISTPYYILRST